MQQKRQRDYKDNFDDFELRKSRIKRNNLIEEFIKKIGSNVNSSALFQLIISVMGINEVFNEESELNQSVALYYTNCAQRLESELEVLSLDPGSLTKDEKLDICQKLVLKANKLNINIRDANESQTALQCAIYFDYPKIVRWLIGINIKQNNFANHSNFKSTPLAYAICLRHFEIAEYLFNQAINASVPGIFYVDTLYGATVKLLYKNLDIECVEQQRNFLSFLVRLMQQAESLFWLNQSIVVSAVRSGYENEVIHALALALTSLSKGHPVSSLFYHSYGIKQTFLRQYPKRKQLLIEACLVLNDEQKENLFEHVAELRALFDDNLNEEAKHYLFTLLQKTSVINFLTDFRRFEVFAESIPHFLVLIQGRPKLADIVEQHIQKLQQKKLLRRSKIYRLAADIIGQLNKKNILKKIINLGSYENPLNDLPQKYGIDEDSLTGEEILIILQSVYPSTADCIHPPTNTIILDEDSPLSSAVCQNYTQIAAWLISVGENLFIYDSEHITLLATALQNKNFKMADIIFSNLKLPEHLRSEYYTRSLMGATFDVIEDTKPHLFIEHLSLLIKNGARLLVCSGGVIHNAHPYLVPTLIKALACVMNAGIGDTVFIKKLAIEMELTFSPEQKEEFLQQCPRLRKVFDDFEQEEFKEVKEYLHRFICENMRWANSEEFKNFSERIANFWSLVPEHSDLSEPIQEYISEMKNDYPMPNVLSL